MRKSWGYIWVAMATLIWGTWSLFLRPTRSLGPISPFTQACLVQVAGTLVILPFAIRRRLLQVPWRVFRAAGFSAVCDAISVALFFSAMTMTTLALATLTHNLAPVFVALSAPWLERRRQNTTVLLGVGLAIVGVLLVASPWQQLAMDSYWGLGLGLLSAVMFAIHIILGQRAAQTLTAFENLAFHRLVAALVLACFSGRELVLLLPGQYLLLFAGGALVNGFAGLLFFMGLKHCQAEKAAVLTLLEPVGAVILGMLVWQEELSFSSFCGVMLVLASVYLVIGQSNHEPNTSSTRQPPHQNTTDLRYSVKSQ